MIYEVRVLAPSGKVKHVISGEQLSNSHWKKFESRGNPFMLHKTKQGNAWVKANQKMEIISISLETGAQQGHL